MTSSVAHLIAKLIDVEGGYVHDPSDAGGETNFGITIEVARENGYTGSMRDMPRSIAEKIYENKYWFKPKFDNVSTLSYDVAVELFDTGVNMGQFRAAEFLQISLNALNRQGKDYADIAEDGDVGPKTIKALTAYIKHRGKAGTVVLLKALNCLQGARYINNSREREKSEDFVYGWLDNRVSL